MKPQFIEKLADLMTSPVSHYRVLPDHGSCRIAGSLPDVGTFELVASYEGDVMDIKGHCGPQYLTIVQEEKNMKIRVLRRNGAFIKNDTVLKADDKLGLIDWFQQWKLEVAKDVN